MMIGKMAEVISGALIGRYGTIVSFDGEMATLKTRSSKITVPVEELEIEDSDVDFELTTLPEPTRDLQSCAMPGDWYDPYAEKT